MKNVVVFALSGGHYAVELRWVREVFALGAVTPVPTAPSLVAGVVNFRGAIVPLLYLTPRDGEPAAGKGAPALPRAGDGAILLEVEAMRFALRVDNIDEVTTLQERPGGEVLVDARGRDVPLIDPAALAAAAVAAAGGTTGAEASVPGAGS